MPAETIAPATAGGGAAAAFPVVVDSLQMNVTTRATAGAYCAGYQYPIFGGAAYDAAVRSAIGGGPAIRRVRVTGQRLVFSYAAGPTMFGQAILAPTATIVTRLHIDTVTGRNEATILSNGTGYRQLNGYPPGCGVLGDALADAYRASLRDMSRQIADQLWLVSWTGAGKVRARR